MVDPTAPAIPLDEDIERPTVIPPFDVARYAHDSDVRLVTVARSTTQPPPIDPRSLRDEPDAAGEPDGVVVSVAPPERWVTAELDAIPVLLVSREDVSWLELGPRAAALVGRMDDRTTVQDILAATRTETSDGVALFERLAESGVVAFV